MAIGGPVGFDSALDGVGAELSIETFGSIRTSLVVAELVYNVIAMEPEDFFASLVVFVLLTFLKESRIFATAGFSGESTSADEYEASLSGMRNDPLQLGHFPRFPAWKSFTCNAKLQRWHTKRIPIYSFSVVSGLLSVGFVAFSTGLIHPTDGCPRQFRVIGADCLQDVLSGLCHDERKFFVFIVVGIGHAWLL